MSLIFTDTLRGGQVSGGTQYGKVVTGGAWYSNSTGGRTPGTGSWMGNGGASSIKRVVAAAEEHATFIAGMATKPPNGYVYGSEVTLLNLMSDAGTTTHLTVTLDGARKLRVYRGAVGGTLLGTTALQALAVADTYYYVEIKATLDDSAGAVALLVDGTSVLTLTGIDTKNAGTKTVFDAVQFWTAASSWVSSDVFICNGAGSVNNDFLYAPRIYALQATAAGATTQGVPSSGVNNWDLVNDSPPNTVGYVDLVNTGDKDTYVIADISGLPAGNLVKGAMVWALAQKTDAGPREVTLVARSGGGTEADLAATTPLINGTFTQVGAAFEALPGGGTFDITALNAMEFGIKAG